MHSRVWLTSDLSKILTHPLSISLGLVFLPDIDYIYKPVSKVIDVLAGMCRHVPLYLEWAPANLMTGVKRSIVAEKTKAAVGDKRAVVEVQVAALNEDDDVDQARSVFVKNLNFATTEASLQKHFQQKSSQGAVRSVTVSFYILIAHLLLFISFIL